MDWEAIGATGEVLGAIAVLLTLLYLSAQIRQSNKMARFETTREVMAQFNACNQLFATDHTIRSVLLKTDELNLEESEQLYSYVDMYCNAWVTVQLAFDQDLIDDALVNGTLRDVEVAMNRWPKFRDAVERWFNNYPDFKNSRIFEAINQHQ